MRKSKRKKSRKFKHKSFPSELHKAQNTISRLKKINKELNTENKELITENKELITENKELRRENSGLQNWICKLEQQVKNLMRRGIYRNPSSSSDEELSYK